jgi:hypothetical protein
LENVEGWSVMIIKISKPSLRGCGGGADGRAIVEITRTSSMFRIE